jgi:GFO/IDH/MocA oxidoreductase family protein
MFDDDQETPNVIAASYEFDHGGKKKMLEFEVRHWISNHEAGIGDAATSGRPDRNTVGDIFYGTKGYLAIGRGGFQTYLGREQAPGPKNERRPGDLFANFIDAMRSRKRENQMAEIEEGAISTMLVHLANISYRTGRTLYFDPETYTCKGDKEATAMFTRSQYRPPFVVPKLA